MREDFDLDENPDSVPVSEGPQAAGPEGSADGGAENIKLPRRHHVVVPLLIILAVVFVGGILTFVYIRERKLPADVVERFLECARDLDFEGMASYVQSSDLTVLDDWDIRNEVFRDFFKGVCRKLDYSILRSNVNLNNDTAKVSVHLKYPDETEPFKKTIEEFLRVEDSRAVVGERLSEEAEKRLAGILMEKAAAAEDSFAEMDVTYPLIKADGEWKIVSLEKDTVRAMSANLRELTEEAVRGLAGTEKEKEEASEGAAFELPVDERTMDIDCAQFTIKYHSHRVTEDSNGKPCLMLYYEYTNNGVDVSSARTDAKITAYQHGRRCPFAVPAEKDSALDLYMEEIQPLETALVCQAFSLADDSDVTIQAEPAIGRLYDILTTQVLQISGKQGKDLHG